MALLSLNIPSITRDNWSSVIDANRMTQKAFSRIAYALGPNSTPTFSTLTLTDLTVNGLTGSRLVSTSASKELTSVSSLSSWIAGTANEINVSDDGDGTITIGIVDPLIVGKGGTGVATLTDHSILLGSGTDAVTSLGVATNGQLPIGSTGADPVLATITGTANQITVTNGAGTITLSAAQDLGEGSSPSFVGIGVIGVADEAERLALSVDPGFIVYQQDTGELYLRTIL